MGHNLRSPIDKASRRQPMAGDTALSVMAWYAAVQLFLIWWKYLNIDKLTVATDISYYDLVIKVLDSFPFHYWIYDKNFLYNIFRQMEEK